jgi:imidazolonepropionase-like amidohydrolase
VPLATASAQDIKAITGVTLIDGTGRAPIEDAVVVIEGDRIVQVGARAVTKGPAGARVIDARGKFVIPGLADMHNHLGSGGLVFGTEDLGKNLRQLLAWGVTTAFNMSIDMKSFTDLKAASAVATPPSPRFLAVGRGFATIGGYRPSTADQARAAVREQKAANVDAVKLGYDDMSWLSTRPIPLLHPEVVEAVIDESHEQGLKVYVHAPILRYAKEALRSGADGLVHGIISEPVDGEFIDLMKRNGAVYISTLALFEACADIAGWTRRLAQLDGRGLIAKTTWDSWASPAVTNQFRAVSDNTVYLKEQLPILRRNLKRVADEGIPIVIGTDTGFPGVILGVSSQMEIVLHVDSGLTPDLAIRGATINAARMVGREEEWGSIEPGKLADLVILDANPLDDIRNIARVGAVVARGHYLDQGAMDVLVGRDRNNAPR